MKTGIIIQARMGSTRLAGKVLKPLPYNSNQTVIGQIIRRAKAVNNVDEIIVATSVHIKNDLLIEWIQKYEPDVKIFTGSEDNVLERYYHASNNYKLDTVVRLTGDNPCIDPEIIEQTINEHNTNKSDYTLTTGYPIGMNVEVISKYAIEDSFINAILNDEFEHVTPYIRKNPDKYKILEINAQQKYSIRLTIDTEIDYRFMCILYDYLYTTNNLFNINNIYQIYKKHPYIFEINQLELQKRVYYSIDEELQDALKILNTHNMNYAAEVLSKAIEKEK